MKKQTNKVKKFNQFVNENIIVIDYILDKINKHGIESLSEKDKDVLNGVYQNKKIDVSLIENEIFTMLCNNEDEDNILFDIEEETNIHSHDILPIYYYCKKVYDNIEELFNNLSESPSVYDFFEFFVSYNTDSYLSLFNNDKEWIITKSFKESFENEDIDLDDEDFDNMKYDIIKCFELEEIKDKFGTFNLNKEKEIYSDQDISKPENFIPKSGDVGSKMNGGLLVNKEQKLIVSEIDLGQTDWENAKKLCSDYRGGGFNDWRLPTKDELNQIYLLYKMNVDNLLPHSYWSSSIHLSIYYWVQYFVGGHQNFTNKTNKFCVRPVRNFINCSLN